ncbi:MAG: hypothetical protein ACI8ZM_003214 [Crocinitomix sp.]|jgi:uncharacterized protein (DUF1800 family)
MKLTTRDKYHLHSRAEFFSSQQDLVKQADLDKAVDAIFKAQNSTTLAMDLPKWNPDKNKKLSQKQKKELRSTWRKQVHELNYKWFQQMLCKNHGLVEKMTLFWHGHFACNTKSNPYTTLELNNILRTNSLGNFRDLLFGVSKSTAMIAYLHLRQNKKGKPNEDFARELCELFTLGRDVDYTEIDVTEIARAFTGWTTDAEGKHVVNASQHDSGEKMIFGKSGNFSGEDVLEMILANSNCAKLIAQKVYRFFVAEKLNEQHVNELSNALFSSNYDITVMMKFLFKAEWFYQTQGKIVKSPIEFLVGLGKAFDLKFPDQKSVRRIQQYLGQVLFEPPNVAGWAGGRKWIDASRFALRLRLGSLILNKGYIMDELSPELDAMISKKTKRKDLKFFEEVDWDAFWKRNKDVAIFDLLIRNENPALKAAYNANDTKTIVRLLSTPDFQLT